MYIKRNLELKTIAKFAWSTLLFYTIYGAIVLYTYHFLDHKGLNIAIPFLPLSTIGIAVAFYIGFKNNQSYDRFWEGRKIWGGIVNYSRTWGNQVLTYVTNEHAKEKVDPEELANIHKRLIYRHIAWINALRLQLRRPSSFSKVIKGSSKVFHKGASRSEEWLSDVRPFILDENEAHRLEERANIATQLVRDQGKALNVLLEKGHIEIFRHIELMSSLEEFYNLQGKCERIKNTPLPRQYAFFSGVFTWVFILLLPFGLVGEFATMGHDFIWLTLPFYILISWIFMTMEMVGDNSEDPFENFINDVPMTALCRTIEIDLKDMLDEDDLPEKIQPVNNVLM